MSWTAQPISPVCEKIVGSNSANRPIFCERPTDWAYPADGAGFMALCREHGRLMPGTRHVTEWIDLGHTFENQTVMPL